MLGPAATTRRCVRSALAAAAQTAGVERFVYTFFAGVEWSPIRKRNDALASAREMTVPAGLVGALVSCALLAACSGGERGQVAAPDVPDSVRVTSPAFSDGDRLPTRFTCDGEGAVPPLRWSGGPEDPAAWAVVVDDPDAPGGTFVHWVVLDLPPQVQALTGGTVPDPAVEPPNSSGDPGYTPACPPEGRHRYRFAVYALSRPTGLTADAGLEEALTAVSSRSVARGRLVATYERH